MSEEGRSGFTQDHYLLGIEGLALLRANARRSYAQLDARVGEIGEIVAGLEAAPGERRDLPAVDAAAGYAGWAASYDGEENDTVAAEEPIVRALLDQLPPGPVLDAACGTGRHTAHLAASGRHHPIGVDASEAMLARAREKLPQVDLRQGDLTALPLGDGEVGGAVCALALSHLPELGPAVAELARVLRPGGRLVISNPHPFATAILDWRAVFVDEARQRRTIPEYPHRHGDYVEAFAAAGLVVRRCVEPGLDREAATARAKGGRAEAFAEALTGVPAVIVWEAERV